MTASNSTSAQVKNGVNVDALLGAREALEKAPEAAPHPESAPFREQEPRRNGLVVRA